MTQTNKPTYTACSCSLSLTCFCAQPFAPSNQTSSVAQPQTKSGEILIPGHLKTTGRVLTRSDGRKYHIGVFVDNNGMEWEVVSPETAEELRCLDGELANDDDDDDD